LLTGVEQLVGAHVLHERDGRLAFRHDVIREAVRMSCPLSVRRALEPSDPGAAAELSRHAVFLIARGHPDRGELVAETTLQLHAAGWLDEASAFAEEHLKDVLRTRDETAVCLSVASMFAVSPHVRVQMSRRALTLPELSPQDQAQHWSRLVYNLVQAGRADESRALMERATAEVEAAQHPPSATILMLAQDAHQYVEGYFGESLRLHEAAIRRGFGPGEANREWPPPGSSQRSVGAKRGRSNSSRSTVGVSCCSAAGSPTHGSVGRRPGRPS
jgi:hypothetical protein